MSLKDQRQCVIDESLSKLVQEMTKCEPNDACYKHYHTLATSIIKNHHNVSCNSFEIQRTVNGILEKFRLENLRPQAECLSVLCDNILQSTVCQNHYEVDIQWKLVDFLFTVAFNPVRALKLKSFKILPDIPKEEEESTNESETDYTAILQEDNVKLTQWLSSDSELSDWSADAGKSDKSTNSDCTDEETSDMNPKRLDSTQTLKPKDEVPRELPELCKIEQKVAVDEMTYFRLYKYMSSRQDNEEDWLGAFKAKFSFDSYAANNNAKSTREISEADFWSDFSSIDNLHLHSRSKCLTPSATENTHSLDKRLRARARKMNAWATRNAPQINALKNRIWKTIRITRLRNAQKNKTEDASTTHKTIAKKKKGQKYQKQAKESESTLHGLRAHSILATKHSSTPNLKSKTDLPKYDMPTRYSSRTNMSSISISPIFYQIYQTKRQKVMKAIKPQFTENWPYTGRESEEKHVSNESITSHSPCTMAKLLQAPQERITHRFLDPKDCLQCLERNLTPPWWLPEYNFGPSSQLPAANFALWYRTYLSMDHENCDNEVENVCTLAEYEELQIASEENLLRELIWMYHEPVSCKFFHLTKDDELQLRHNVTIPSASAKALHMFLEHNFLPHLKMMDELKSFIRNVYELEIKAPKTFECFANSLNILLQPIWHVLLQWELRIQKSGDLEINTVLQMSVQIRESMERLTLLFNIYSSTVLDCRTEKAHICSAHLLTNLLRFAEESVRATDMHLAISLFLKSIQTFCEILQSWWFRGCFEDFDHEFPIENISTTDGSVLLRSFQPSSHIKILQSSELSPLKLHSEFLNIIIEHCEESVKILTLLQNIDCLSEMRRAWSDLKAQDIYKEFLQEMQYKVFQLQSSLSGVSVCKPAPSPPTFPQLHTSLIKDDTLDQHLKEALECCNRTYDSQIAVNATIDVQQIFETLQQSGNTMLPLDILACEALKQVLNSRIRFAKNFANETFLKQFDMKMHFLNLRKVYFFEAGNLMHDFSVHLFERAVDKDERSFVAYNLNFDLHEALSSSDFLTLFEIEILPEIEGETNKVFQSVDRIYMTYKCSKGVSYIINEECLAHYNNIFKLLLKFKWSMMALENLTLRRMKMVNDKQRNINIISEICVEMHRLEVLRVWLMNYLRNMQFYLLSKALHSKTADFDKNIAKCQNIDDIKRLHYNYLENCCEQCLLKADNKDLMLGIEQLLRLAYVLELAWNRRILDYDYYTSESEDMNSTQNPKKHCSGSYISKATREDSLFEIYGIEQTFTRARYYLLKTFDEKAKCADKRYLALLVDLLKWN